MSRKTITFICGGVNGPSSRFRVTPIKEKLEESGWNCKIVYEYGETDTYITNFYLKKIHRLISRTIRAIRTSFTPSSDIVVIQRLALPWISLPERIIANRNIPLVFDFDDAVDLGRNGGKSILRSKALRKIFKASSVTVAGNEWLAQKSLKYVQTEVIPTCIDINKYYPGTNNNKKLTIGWMGTSSNYVELELTVDVIKDLRAEGYEFNLKIISDLKNDRLIDQLCADFEYWSAEKEVAQLQSFDIGLMPLRDIEWTKGKCSFKIIQYMAVGIPSVASEVGFNKDVVSDGVNGYLVSDRNSWKAALQKLIANADLRKEMGKAARNNAVNRFSVDKAAEKYDRIFKDLIN